jgi:hemerythrin-like domain-containing protein
LAKAARKEEDMNLADTVRHEHEFLLRGIEALRQAADLIGETHPGWWGARANSGLDFVRQEVIPHARREEEVLYPAVARIMKSPDATSTMVWDHAEIADLTLRLARAMEESDLRTVRRLLYGLYHVIQLHVAKEEGIYLPLIERRLSAVRSGELLAALAAS